MQLIGKAAGSPGSVVTRYGPTGVLPSHALPCRNWVRAVLVVADADVVDDRVAGDRRRRLIARSAPDLAADHDPELGLPVDLGRLVVVRHLDRVIGTDQ